MKVRNALILAGAMLAFSAAVAFTDKAGYIGAETAQRVIQVAIGFMVVYFANLAPKTLEPLVAGCEPSRIQALQRFCGWTLVLGGLGYSLAWLVAPIEHAAISAIAILGTGVLMVAARYAWTLGTRGRDQPHAGL